MVAVCISLSSTFLNFVPLCRYHLHVIFWIIIVLGVGYASLRYKAKMTSVTARTKSLTVVCICYVSGLRDYVLSLCF